MLKQCCSKYLQGLKFFSVGSFLAVNVDSYLNRNVYCLFLKLHHGSNISVKMLVYKPMKPIFYLLLER